MVGWHLDMSLIKLWEIVQDREAWHAADHGGHKESDITERLTKRVRFRRSGVKPEIRIHFQYCLPSDDIAAGSQTTHWVEKTRSAATLTRFGEWFGKPYVPLEC